MEIVIIIGFVVIVLAILNIDGKLKRNLESNERIIARLDILIKNQKDKE
ncbi:hypothetical protein H8B09_23310 [Paenibacillus sp. PR3]|uniref:YrzO family protein n=1 Tax=Paenibacillus terricola TaxID=2763503 RepID=A0ABR8N0J4_9BACL|nr:hypothetical protein [Paenibacillus terricola]MBD3921714.1 hypothetical protein [Paenibacillus terricola]